MILTTGLPLVVLMLAAVSAFSFQKEPESLFKINPEKENGDFELKIKKEGPAIIVSMKGVEGESTTEILEDQGIELEIPSGSNVCYVKSLDEKIEGTTGCTELLPADQLPEVIRERCGERQVFARVQCQNNALRSLEKRGCYTTCWYCGGGICCGVTCSF